MSPEFLNPRLPSRSLSKDNEGVAVLVQTAVRSEGPDSENGNSECMAVWLALVKHFNR